MDEIGFTCPTKELLEKIHGLRSLLKGAKRKKARLEVGIEPQFVTFNIEGGSFRLMCQTKGWSIFNVPFEYFFLILRDYPFNVFSVKVKDDGLDFGGMFLSGLSFKTKYVQKQIAMDLPLNYSDNDLLALTKKYPMDVVIPTSASLLVAEAEGRFDERIRLAHKHLVPYGISFDELTEFVRTRIDDVKTH